jgi:hypothetical protein
MNTLRRVLSHVCIFAVASAHAEEPAKFTTAEQITAMVPRAGTLTKRSDFSATFKMEDGREFILGDQVGAQEVWHYVNTLKEGQTYKFPDAFLLYRKSSYYEDAKQIAAMPPRTATLASRTPCSAYFTMADGNGFHLGGPGSGAEVSQFLWSLKVGPAYKFPEVFAAYQAAPGFSTAQDVAAMTPHTGTLTGYFDGFCYFATADGKGFVIGSRGNGPVGPEVNRFLRTLKEDETYKFPDAFVEFQQAGKK